MIYRFYGVVAAMLFVLGVTGFAAINRTTNWKPAKATVSTIDRSCDFIETTTEGGHKTARGLSDNCDSTGEWEKRRDAVREKHAKKVSGTAVVHLAYTAPQDGSYRTADLRFTGRDDEFYALQAGSEINILVSNSDPSKIQKD
jgi:hypothetical protein